MKQSTVTEDQSDINKNLTWNHDVKFEAKFSDSDGCFEMIEHDA